MENCLDSNASRCSLQTAGCSLQEAILACQLNPDMPLPQSMLRERFLRAV